MYEYETLFATLHESLRQEIYLNFPFHVAPTELAHNGDFAKRWMAVNMKGNNRAVMLGHYCDLRDEESYHYTVQRCQDSLQQLKPHSTNANHYSYTPALTLEEKICGCYRRWSWHNNGQIAEVICADESGYGDGIVPHGSRTIWYSNGKICQQAEYYQNAPVGVWTCYYETGELESETTYLDKDGNQVTYDVFADYEYRAGQDYMDKHDNYDVLIYYKSGNKAKLAHYRDGIQADQVSRWLDDDENTLSESSYFEYDQLWS